ncbi:MAG: protein-L-isoaspartate(D-aspartate) O-methyltransferase [Candidatus Omnitrophica bacterium]|nr:protein-L-isoaspartate(D-aspartate) O-methyltransferase [Candidatus Omnitrophota bacterium]
MYKTGILLSIFLIFGLTECVFAEEDFTMRQREQMVDQQIERRGILDKKVLDAMRRVQRHLFVPPELHDTAYEDYPLPIGYGQTISQPYIVAYMTETALLKAGDKVLEIGTGSGYQAAILAEIVDEVYSIEIVQGLAETAEERLKGLGYENIYVRCGDGYKGWPEKAPFDAIIVTAAPDAIPQELVHQLKVGGRMIIPIGSIYQELYRITRTEGGTKKETLLPVRFVPMVHGDE